MKAEFLFPGACLQVFADGAAAGSAGEGGQGTGVTAEAAAPQKSKGVKNPLADVKYGIQEEEAPAAGVESMESREPEKTGPPDAPADRDAEFERLIKGEFKDLYDRKMQDIIQKRLKGSKQMEDRLTTLTPALELLGKKYGVDPADASALSRAIADDDALYADEATEKGMDVGTFKQLRKMELENASLSKAIAQQERREQAAQQYAQWQQQAQEARKIYPSLDLKEECGNPQFMQLLRSGVDVGSAYLVLHKDDIIPAAMQHTAKVVEQKLAGKMMSASARPGENGVGSQSAAITKSDVGKLTKADREEIRRRVARGERIRF